MHELKACTHMLTLHSRTWRYVQEAMLDCGGYYGPLFRSTFIPLPLLDTLALVPRQRGGNGRSAGACVQPGLWLPPPS